MPLSGRSKCADAPFLQFSKFLWRIPESGVNLKPEHTKDAKVSRRAQRVSLAPEVKRQNTYNTECENVEWDSRVDLRLKAFFTSGAKARFD
jgi:hypothetical protein